MWPQQVPATHWCHQHHRKEVGGSFRVLSSREFYCQLETRRLDGREHVDGQYNHECRLGEIVFSLQAVGGEKRDFNKSKNA